MTKESTFLQIGTSEFSNFCSKVNLGNTINTKLSQCLRETLQDRTGSRWRGESCSYMTTGLRKQRNKKQAWRRLSFIYIYLKKIYSATFTSELPRLLSKLHRNSLWFGGSGKNIWFKFNYQVPRHYTFRKRISPAPVMCPQGPFSNTRQLFRIA